MATDAEIEKLKKAHFLDLANYHDVTLDDVADMSFDEMTQAVKRQQDERRSEQLETLFEREEQAHLKGIAACLGAGKTQTALDLMNEAKDADSEVDAPTAEQRTAKITGYDETLIQCPCGEYCDAYIDAGELVECECGRVFELTVSNEPNGEDG